MVQPPTPPAMPPPLPPVGTPPPMPPTGPCMPGPGPDLQSAESKALIGMILGIAGVATLLLLVCTHAFMLGSQSLNKAGIPGEAQRLHAAFGIAGVATLSLFLSIPAFILGSQSLAILDRPGVVSSARGRAVAARILGIIGTILGVLPPGFAMVTVLWLLVNF